MASLPFGSESFDIKYSSYALNPRNISSTLYAMDTEIYDSQGYVDNARLGSYLFLSSLSFYTLPF